MGLFDKKYCDICKNKIGLLGNKKLADGNLCKDCAAKLSPFFSERRQSTVEEIRQQLAYREENRKAVEAFHVTRSLGRDVKVLLDEDARKFVVTRSKKLIESNPDVLDFSQVTGAQITVDEHRTELRYADKDGHQVSYRPPRYDYSYNLSVDIYVNSPYFDCIKVPLNSIPIKVGQQPISQLNASNAGRGVSTVKGQLVSNALGILSGQGTKTVASWNAEYNSYYNVGEEIVAALTRAREEVRSEIAAQNAPKTARTCPWCGATTLPDAAGCCEYCGGSLKG